MGEYMKTGNLNSEGCSKLSLESASCLSQSGLLCWHVANLASFCLVFQTMKLVKLCIWPSAKLVAAWN